MYPKYEKSYTLGSLDTLLWMYMFWKIFVIFVGYKVLYFLQENDILYQSGLEIFVGYEVLYFPQENDILHQPRLVCESL